MPLRQLSRFVREYYRAWYRRAGMMSLVFLAPIVIVAWGA
jgi:hypothetical protein